MTKYSFIRKLGLISVALAASGIVAGCKTAPIVVRAPSLDYVASADQCTDSFSFSDVIGQPEDPKARKKIKKSQRLYLGADMGADETGCTLSSAGNALPYAVFEIPTGITGRVISAGSELDTAVIFAADVSTYDETGQRVRRFQRNEFRRLGSVYGVQFSPKADEAFVVIQADPTLVGAEDSTVEINAYAQDVTVAYGGLVSSGTNTVGVQKTFDRTYAYNGDVAVITVFPKQAKE